MTRRTDRPWPPPHIARTRPNGRTATIRATIERFLRDHKRIPSDMDLAVLLATSPARIRRHRDLLGM